MEYAVYMDHNATTPVRPEAAAAAYEALALIGNPSSVHRFGRAARRTMEDAREQVAALVGARPADVVFTSGGTEANSLAVRGSGRRRVLISAMEHVSVLDATKTAERIPVDDNGVVDVDALECMLDALDEPALVSVMLANNETGVIQPIAEVAEIARRRGALVHCDAVQAAGKIPVDMPSFGAHMLTLSAHKIGGPAGCGALIVTDEVAIQSAFNGGGQERGRRAGSENLSGIAGFGAAADVVSALPDAGRLKDLRDDLENTVRGASPGTQIFGEDAPRLANTSCLSMPGVASETQVMALDLAGIAVSAGSACSSGKVTRSHVLEAMGVKKEDATSAIRVSLGWTSTEKDVRLFGEAWMALHARLVLPAEAVAPAACEQMKERERADMSREKVRQ